MVRKFCTLREAAERLNATQDQIEHLVKRGILHEFRDGSHRLLKTAEVGAIVVARNRRLERQGQPRSPGTSRTPATARSSELAAAGSAEIRLPRTAATPSPAPSRRPRSPDASPRIPQKKTSARAAEAHRPASARFADPPPLSVSLRQAQRRREPEPPMQRHDQSLGRWFWTGLLQDSPVAIAMLSMLILLVVAALVGGMCMLADAL
jgi:excisionase family DNA binding protein